MGLSGKVLSKPAKRYTVKKEEKKPERRYYGSISSVSTSNKVAYEKWKDNSLSMELTEDQIYDILLKRPLDIAICVLLRHRSLDQRTIEGIYYLTAGLYHKNEDKFSKEDLYKAIDLRWYYSSDKEAVKNIDRFIYLKSEGFRKALNYKMERPSEYFKDLKEMEFCALPTSLLVRLKDILSGKDEKERIDWKAVHECQDVSEEFKERFANKFKLIGYKADDNFIPQGNYRQSVYKREYHENWINNKKKKETEG